MGTQFYVEDPPVGRGATSYVGAMQFFEYADCGQKNFLCLSGRAGAWPLGEVNPVPIVLPSEIEPGRSYEYQDVFIESRHVSRGPATNAVRLIVRRAKEDAPREWYVLTVVAGRGVVEMHFSNIHTWASTSAQPLTIQDVTCALVSKKGLFPKVRVKRAPENQ